MIQENTLTVKKEYSLRKTDSKRNVRVELVIFAALYIVVHIIFSKLLRRTLNFPSLASAWIQLASYMVLGVAGIYLFKDDLKKGMNEWRTHFWKSILWLVGGYITHIILANLSALPLMLLAPEYESINDNNVAAIVGIIPSVIIILSLGMMGPIVEELIFRVIPSHAPNQVLLNILKICIPAVLFMAIHMHAFTLNEVLYNLQHLATGLLYGIIIVRSKNPTLTIMLHILNNLPILIMMNIF